MISRIHSTTIIVADQEAALDFFVNTLEWKKAIDYQMGTEMRFLTVVPPGAATQLVLALESWFIDGNNTGKHSGITLISPDIEATYTDLQARGVKFKQPIEDMPWGGKATWFYDIDGNKFFLTTEG